MFSQPCFPCISFSPSLPHLLRSDRGHRFGSLRDVSFCHSLARTGTHRERSTNMGWLWRQRVLQRWKGMLGLLPSSSTNSFQHVYSTRVFQRDWVHLSLMPPMENSSSSAAAPSQWALDRASVWVPECLHAQTNVKAEAPHLLDFSVETGLRITVEREVRDNPSMQGHSGMCMTCPGHLWWYYGVNQHSPCLSVTYQRGILSQTHFKGIIKRKTVLSQSSTG